MLGRPSSFVWRFCFPRDVREESLSSWVCHPERNEERIFRLIFLVVSHVVGIGLGVFLHVVTEKEIQGRDLNLKTNGVRDNRRREAKNDFGGLGETGRRNDIHCLHVVPNVLSIQIDHDVLEGEHRRSSEDAFVTHQRHFHGRGIAFLDDRRHEVLQTLEERHSRLKNPIRIENRRCSICGSCVSRSAF